MVLFWLNAEWDEVSEDIKKQAFDQMKRVEKEFPDELQKLRDSEMGNQRILVDTSTKDFRESFGLQHQNRIQNLQNNLRSCGIDLIQIQSHLPVIDPLIKFLRMREKRGMS